MTPQLLKEEDGPIISRELKILIHIFCLPVVPHEAVPEVSKGNLYIEQKSMCLKNRL